MKKFLLPLLLIIANVSFGQRHFLDLKFNGNAYDNSSKTFAVVHGAKLVSDRHGRPNMAYEFDGIDDFIELPANSIDFKNRNSFSLECYVKFHETSGTYGPTNSTTRTYSGGSIFSLYGAPYEKADLFFLWYSQDRIVCSHRSTKVLNTSQQNMSYAPNQLFNKYHHLVFVRNGEEGKMLLYVDGHLAIEKKISPIEKMGSFPVHIGTHKSVIRDTTGNIEGYNSYFFKGKMDYLLIHKSALSATKIKRIYYKKSKPRFNYSKNIGTKKITPNHNQKIKVYPNPSNGNIFINTNMNCKEIRIYNQCGKLVHQQEFNNNLNLTFLKKGFYFITFITPEKNYSRRLIITR